MATFTMELWEVIETLAGTAEVVDGRRVLDCPLLGLDYYPIFDESYRGTLNGLIVDSFYNREIGSETTSMFRLALRRHMNLHMPMFNKRYLAAKMQYDPLSTVDLTTMTAATAAQRAVTTGENTSTSHGKNAARNIYSDTPQDLLADNGQYASNAADATSWADTDGTSVDEGSSETNSDSDTSSHTTGYQGAAARLMREYQESLLNIDLMVIDSLAPLFMQVWNTSESYTSNQLGW